MIKSKILTLLMVVTVLIGTVPVLRTQAAEIRNITFPIVGAVSYREDFGDPRVGHTHEGNDIFGKKMMPLVAVVDGTITFTPYPQPSYGYMVSIRDTEGYKYNYIHMNNDTPGTDDGKGGGINAYAVDILDGNPVVKGQLIGWLGDSGNAEGTPPHVHFEIRRPDGTPISPYLSLKAAPKLSAPLITYPQLPNEVLPYGSGFASGANVATGKFDADTKNDYVTAPASKGGPHIKIFDSNNNLISQFFAYDQNFTGGVDVAAGDIDGDGTDEIITAPNRGGGPQIKIFKLDGTLLSQFMAYDPKFFGGLRVSSADIDNDNKFEIITVPGPGGGPHVKIFKSDGTVLSQFMAYDPLFKGGVDLAGVSSTSNRTAKVITAPGPGGGPHVRVFNIDGSESSAFMAYDPNFKGGIKVSTGNVSDTYPDIEIVTAPFSAGGPHLKMFDLSARFLEEKFSLEPWWMGGYDIAANSTGYFISTTAQFGRHRRRTTVRKGDFRSFRFNNDRTPFGLGD